jgi:hypothetical protein
MFPFHWYWFLISLLYVSIRRSCPARAKDSVGEGFYNCLA